MTNNQQGHIFEGWYRRFTTIALGLISGMIFVEAAFADIVNTATTSAQYSGADIVSAPSMQSIAVAPADPQLVVTKVGTLDNGGDGVSNVGDTINYTFTVTNSGNVTLSNVTLDDPLVSISGGPLTPLNVGTSDSITFSAEYTLDQVDIDLGRVVNTATVSGEAPSGLLVGSLSDDPANPANIDSDIDGLPDDPTVTLIVAAPSLETTNTMVVVENSGNSFNDAGDIVNYTITLENTGNVTLTSVEIESYTLTRIDSTLLALDTGPSFVSNSGSSIEGTLAPGEIATYSASYVVVQADVDASGITSTATGAGTPPTGSVVADVSDNGNDFDGNLTDDPTVLNLLSANSLVATKGAGQLVVLGGDLVEYTLEFTNTTQLDITGADLIDILPVGVFYEPNSALVDGIAREPVILGNELIWSNVPITMGASATVTFSAVVSLGADGELTNRTRAQDSLTGQPISNTAEVTIRRQVEHVFDCSDVIGKVFDDENYNGYQNQDEPGLSGVKIATVNGEIITVDEYGRFSVPCAALPTDIGTNFILKLDDRTLPQGYHVGTENPRVIRVTKGKVSKLNFGAVITDIIQIELNGNAFKGSSVNPADALLRGFEQVVQKFSGNPLTVNIEYTLGNEGEALMQARFGRLEDVLQVLWSRSSDHKLNIQATATHEK